MTPRGVTEKNLQCFEKYALRDKGKNNILYLHFLNALPPQGQVCFVDLTLKKSMYAQMTALLALIQLFGIAFADGEENC